MPGAAASARGNGAVRGLTASSAMLEALSCACRRLQARVVAARRSLFIGRRAKFPTASERSVVFSDPSQHEVLSSQCEICRNPRGARREKNAVRDLETGMVISIAELEKQQAESPPTASAFDLAAVSPPRRKLKAAAGAVAAASRLARKEDLRV